MAQDLSKSDVTQPEEDPIMREVVDDVSMYVEDFKDRERTLWQKMFPDRQQRQIDMAKYKTVKARYEFQRKAIEIAHEAQLQGIQEMYNDFLVKGKAKIRKERSEFFQQQFEHLMTTLSYKSQEFSERMNTAFQQLEKLNHDFLKKHQEELIERIIEGYYETVGKLIQNFQNILDEEIHNPGPMRSTPGQED